MGIFELKNYSEEGVYADTSINKQQLIRNGCRLRYKDMEGEFGYTLTENTVYEGDLILLDDELNLNGYTLTVKGSLIQISGNVNINKGALIVEGDYRIQSREKSEDGYTYGKSSGALIMTNAEDSVLVGGDFFFESVRNISGLLTAGELTVNGDFHADNSSSDCNFISENEHKLIFTGKEKQILVLNEDCTKGTSIANAEFKNTSSEGIEIQGYMAVTNELYPGESKVSGWLRMTQNTYIAGGYFGGRRVERGRRGDGKADRRIADGAGSSWAARDARKFDAGESLQTIGCGYAETGRRGHDGAFTGTVCR